MFLSLEGAFYSCLLWFTLRVINYDDSVHQILVRMVGWEDVRVYCIYAIDIIIFSMV